MRQNFPKKFKNAFFLLLFLAVLLLQFPSRVFATTYLSQITGDANLVSFWRMDESTGAAAFVDSKNSYNATLHGGVTLETASTYITGDFSTASTFDGSTGYASAGDISAFNFTRTSLFTITAIVKPNVTRSGGATNYWVYTKGKDSSPFNGLNFGMRWNGTRTGLFVQFIANYPTQAIRLLGSSDLQNGQAYLVGLTYDGSGSSAGIKMYVDGALISAADDTGGTVSETIAAGQDTTASGYAAEFGRWGTVGQWYKGDTKDVAIFNTAQSQTWMQDLATAAGHAGNWPQYDNVSYTVNQSPRPQIFYDFDMDSDIDDVVDALTLLNLEHRGELDIVGAVSTSCNTKSAPTWMAIASYYNRGDIPTGVNLSSPGNGGCSSLYDTGVAATYGVAGKTDASQFENYITTQRRVLASAADNSIEYITTGDLSSVQGLLESTADAYSDLGGVDLVAQKVSHIWIVAGNWPSGAAVSDMGSNPVISNYVLTHWPTTVPMIFDSITDGNTVYSGQNVMEALPANNPARYAWELYFGNSNASNKREAWSQLAIMSIARGTYPNSITATDYEDILGGSGTGIVNSSTGVTSWDYSTRSNMGYLSKILSDSGFTTAINALILDAAPTVPGTPSATSDANDNTPSWSWTASTDSGDGLAATPYTVQWCGNSNFTGCDSNTSTSATNSFTNSVSLTDGTWYFRVKASDTLGNTSDYSTAGSITIDTTAPTVTDDTPASWQISNIAITLTCTDNGSGCSKVYYTTDDSTPTTGSSYVNAASSWQFTYSTEATSTLKYRGEDALGNLEDTVTATNQLRLDKTGPTISAGSDQSESSSFTQTATASDDGSGIGSSTYQWAKVSGPGTLTFGTDSALSTTISADTAGTYVISFTASDSAGNSNSDTFNLTWTNPTCPTVSNAATYNDYPTCGVATCNSGYRLSGGACVVSGGGGIPAGWLNMPALPTGGFNVVVNQGVSTTTSRIVTLNFNAGSDVKKIAISLTGDFTDASQENYSPTKQIDLCSKLGGLIKSPTCPNGQYTVYVKFYTQYGVASNVVSTKINLVSAPQFSKDFKLGTSDSQIKALQQFLNQNGYKLANSGVGSSGNETNFFGTLTSNALAKFQEANKDKAVGMINEKGFLGPITRQFINSFTSSTTPTITTQQTQNSTSAIFTTPLYKGMTSSDVRRLQTLLATKPEIYPEGLITGYFGPLTRTAVQNFQLSYGVVASSSDPGFGYVGPTTRAKLQEIFGK